MQGPNTCSPHVRTMVDRTDVPGVEKRLGVAAGVRVHVPVEVALTGLQGGVRLVELRGEKPIKGRFSFQRYRHEVTVHSLHKACPVWREGSSPTLGRRRSNPTTGQLTEEHLG